MPIFFTEIHGNGQTKYKGMAKEIHWDGHKNGFGWTREIQGAEPNTGKFSLSEAG